MYKPNVWTHITSVHLYYGICRNDVVSFHGQLSDYLIKVVPTWVKFAVAGPGQSQDKYQEPTLYTTPDYIVPLCRLVSSM